MKIRVGSSLERKASPWAPLYPQQRWYVARVHAQREFEAARQLENQGFRVFVPRYWKSRRHARRIQTVSAPLFPRYIFVIVDLASDRWRSINGTIGVERLLMSGGRPQPVPNGVVESLIHLADSDGNVQFDLRLTEGQTVKVTAGPFAELIGELEKVDDNGRVRVLLDIMGSNALVTMPRSLVGPN